ncbi:noggin-2-like [Anabrus simplex]|uniref:noggin-2-like n=1 Tax=Anabrus simplex TaxID=316456 RepID=UPI0034DD4419
MAIASESKDELQVAMDLIVEWAEGPRTELHISTAIVAVSWLCSAVLCCLSPDSSSPDKPTLPFKLWARSPKSPLKPRQRDLHEPTLSRLLGADLEPRWMRTRTVALADTHLDEVPRQSVSTLRELVAQEDILPDVLTAEHRAAVREWLVQRVTCPVHYVWEDLGPYFWPRWVRRGQCGDEHRGNDTLSCSWPPGMHCAPGTAKTLNILRWHCRLRKNALVTMSWLSADRKYRKKYRCRWLKVPYPVPEDCSCSC